MERIIVESRLILLALAGSQAYGTSTPQSDFDYKGVFIAPKEYYLGFKTFEQKDTGWDTEPGTGLYPMLDGVKDCTVYELRKFLSLADIELTYYSLRSFGICTLRFCSPRRFGQLVGTRKSAKLISLPETGFLFQTRFFHKS